MNEKCKQLNWTWYCSVGSFEPFPWLWIRLMFVVILFFAAEKWCPCWVTERWIVLSSRQVSDCQFGTVSTMLYHAKPSGSACLPRDGLCPSKLQEGGGQLFSSCCPGWNRLFPLSYPPLDSELLEWYVATSNWHPKTNWWNHFVCLAEVFTLFMTPNLRYYAPVTSQSSQLSA